MTPIRNITDRERQLQAQIDALKCYVAKLEPDALRYRWLRDIDNQETDDSICVGDGYFITYFGAELDAAINAAMKEGAQ